jgi:hypothetical protein
MNQLSIIPAEIDTIEKQQTEKIETEVGYAASSKVSFWGKNVSYIDF